MKIIEQLAAHLIETEFDAFAPETVSGARSRVIDTVGCLMAGTRARDWIMMVDLVRDWGGKPESTILPYGDRVPAHNAAMSNSVLSSAFDFDPLGPFVEGLYYPCHISSTTIPTAFAVAEQKGLGGRELLTALILGDDIAARVLAASNYSAASPWSSLGTVTIVGATATAGKLYGLDRQQMVNAFGIMLDQVAGSQGSLKELTHGFKLQHGLASRGGILSAELASRGWTGVKEPLLGEYGYFSLYSQTSRPEVLTRDLGRTFYADSTFKPFPGCLLNQAPTACALELVRQHDIRAEDIAEITVEVSPRVASSSAIRPSLEFGEILQISAGFSLQYNVANALLRRSVTLEHFTDAFIQAPEVTRLAEKIRMRATKTAPEKPLAVTITVTTNRGERLSASVDMPRGGPQSQPTVEEIRQKFRANVAFSQTISAAQAEAILTMLEEIEQVDDVREIFGLMAVPR